MSKRVRWLLIGLVVLALGVAIYWRHERDVNQDLEGRAGVFTIAVEGGPNATASRYHDGRPLISVASEFAELTASAGSWGRHGRTGMQIAIVAPNSQPPTDILRPFAEGLNESPARAREILQHYDLRIRLLGLAAIGEIVQVKNPNFGHAIGIGPLGSLKPHVLDALVDLVKNTDPLIASHALRLLESANCFRADAVTQGLQHRSANVRIEAMEYCQRCQRGKAPADPAELRTALAQLIAHLDDPHLTVRGMAVLTARELMVALEAKLQGVPVQDTGEWTHGVKFVKLPQPPKGYPDLTANAKDVQAVKAEWQAWLNTVPQYGEDQTTAPASEPAK